MPRYLATALYSKRPETIVYAQDETLADVLELVELSGQFPDTDDSHRGLMCAGQSILDYIHAPEREHSDCRKKISDESAAFFYLTVPTGEDESVRVCIAYLGGYISRVNGYSVTKDNRKNSVMFIHDYEYTRFPDKLKCAYVGVSILASPGIKVMFTVSNQITGWLDVDQRATICSAFHLPFGETELTVIGNGFWDWSYAMCGTNVVEMKVPPGETAAHQIMGTPERFFVSKFPIFDDTLSGLMVANPQEKTSWETMSSSLF